jgi:hypothetical protein
MRSRVELFESIRRDSRLAGMGIRALARKHHVHRRTVRQALLSAVPPQRKWVERVGCQKPVSGHAARSYSWIRPPRTSRRWILPTVATRLSTGSSVAVWNDTGLVSVMP